MALGDPGAGEFTLTTDFSKEAMSGVLHQVQHGIERFIGAKGRKCRGYERNYHSSKGELKKVIILFQGIKHRFYKCADKIRQFYNRHMFNVAYTY